MKARLIVLITVLSLAAFSTVACSKNDVQDTTENISETENDGIPNQDIEFDD